MAFKATDEPRLMQAIAEQTTQETLTARMGIFQPGVTWEKIISPGENMERGNQYVLCLASSIQVGPGHEQMTRSGGMQWQLR